jgi:CRISPR-associated protein Cas5
LIENILDLHLDEKLRSLLIKDLKKQLKKDRIDFLPSEFQSASGFQSVIGHLIDFELKLLPATIGYDDLWSQHLKGSDKRHFDGVRNMDWRVGAHLRKAQVGSDKEQREFMKEHGEHLPNYYSSPKRREYLIANEPYKVQIKTTKPLFDALNEAIVENNIAYMGNSESWVHIEIERQ